MSVELVTETVSVPKEAKEVKDLLVQLVADIKAKKTAVEIAGNSLPKLMAAIDGFEKLDEEAKSPQIAVLVGLLGGQIGELFLTPEASV